jgi:4-hydroxy-tetrahydrodipicolinate synthase
MPTPLSKDGSVDRDLTQSLVDFLIEGGIDGLLALGTSGEFALLTREERRALLDVVVDRVNGRVPVYAGVSDPSSENVVRNSADAKEAGADGAIATAPIYYTTTTDGLYKHFRSLAEKIDLPLMLYNIPEWTHVFVPPEVVIPLAEEGFIVGMKHTEYNLLNLLRFITAVGDKIGVFTGADAMTYTCLEFGGSGAIIGVANVAPKIAGKIFDEYRRGNLRSARDAQLELLPLIAAIGVGKFPAGLKEVMNLTGVPVGGVKEPLPKLTAEEVRTVKRYLAQASVSTKSKR